MSTKLDNMALKVGIIEIHELWRSNDTFKTIQSPKKCR